MYKFNTFLNVCFLAIGVYANQNILYFNFSKYLSGPFSDSIIIINDEVIKYKIDISDNKRDTVNYLIFKAIKSNGLIYIDSLIAFNDKDTLLIDDFEEYDTITDVMNPIVTSDKEWGIDCPTGSVIKMSIVFRKKGKCFKVWYYTGMDVYFFLKFHSTQDYSKYNTLQLNISRIHPDSSATSLKNGTPSNNKSGFIKLTSPNTILYTVPPGYHKIVMELYCLSGRKIKTLLNGYAKEGEYSLSLDMYGSGLYYVRASIGNETSTKKVMIVR